MRILHVLAERGFSGGENQLLATLRHLQSRGHEQVLVLGSGGRFQEHVQVLGLETHSLKIRHNYDVVAAGYLRKHFRRIAPDLIHFACSRSHKVGALASAFGRSLPPRVVTRRMDYPIRNTPFRRWIYGRAVTAVVAISEEVRNTVLEVGVDPARVHLIHEGVDTHRFEGLRDPGRRLAARAHLGLTEDDILGVTIASLHRRKAHDVLLRAIDKLRIPTGKHLGWLFGGDGPERESLADQAARLSGRFELRMPGQIDYVEDALSAADVFCIPSRYEGLGVALLEAAAAGVPAVATYVGGMKEVLESGRSGIHVQPDDPEELAAAIQSLIDDPSGAEAMGEAARTRAQEFFSVERMGRETEELYLRLSGGTA